MDRFQELVEHAQKLLSEASAPDCSATCFSGEVRYSKGVFYAEGAKLLKLGVRCGNFYTAVIDIADACGVLDELGAWDIRRSLEEARQHFRPPAWLRP